MEFYVNFTLNENFEENIKSRYRDDSHMNLLVKVKRCVLTLLIVYMESGCEDEE